MNERFETLQRARDRERIIVEKDVHAKVLAATYDGDKAERARNKLIETQAVIGALDRAMNRDGSNYCVAIRWQRAHG